MVSWIMMIALFLALLAGSETFAVAEKINACVEQTDHTIEGKVLPLCWMKSIEGWVSPECVRNLKIPCKALSLHELAIKKSVKLDDDDLTGGKNPGSVLCVKLGGKVKYAVIEGQSQQTFCEAGDGSLMDSNALFNAFENGKRGKK